MKAPNFLVQASILSFACSRTVSASRRCFVLSALFGLRLGSLHLLLVDSQLILFLGRELDGILDVHPFLVSYHHPGKEFLLGCSTQVYSLDLDTFPVLKLELDHGSFADHEFRLCSILKYEKHRRFVTRDLDDLDGTFQGGEFICGFHLSLGECHEAKQAQDDQKTKNFFIAELLAWRV